MAALALAVAVFPPAMANAEAVADSDAGSDPAILSELRAMREDFRSATSEGRDFLKVASGWIAGVATVLVADRGGRTRRAVVRQLQESQS